MRFEFDGKPWCTTANGFFSAAEPSTGAADTGVKVKSLAHSSGRIVPRHATRMSRRPSSAAPSSVATATYPIQLDSLDHAATSPARSGSGRRRTSDAGIGSAARPAAAAPELERRSERPYRHAPACGERQIYHRVSQDSSPSYRC
nr:unnamed protein product [Digitaria exilis]